MEERKVIFLGFNAVNKFKSIFRAFRRGRVDQMGNPIPVRLFHNRKNTCKRKGRHSRYYNELKKKAYADYRGLKEAGRI